MTLNADPSFTERPWVSVLVIAFERVAVDGYCNGPW